MKKIKSDILQTSRKLFNHKGTANVSVREIARTLGISHSNLIYHFKTRNDIIDALHDELFVSAVDINTRAMQQQSILAGLFYSVIHGFEVIYGYRFLLIDLNLIVRENPALHQKLLHVEQARAQMSRAMFQKLIEDGLMYEEAYQNEHEHLIERIRVFSDYWISSSLVYDARTPPEQILKKYSKMFLLTLYPFLTKTGRMAFTSELSKNDF